MRVTCRSQKQPKPEGTICVMRKNGRYLERKSISPPGNKLFIFLGRDETKSHVLDKKSEHIKLTTKLKKLKTGKK